jgi:hypothetical protein
MSSSYLAVATPVGSAVGAVSLQTMSYGTLQYRDASGVKTGTESPVDVAASQTWAFRSPKWLGGFGWTGLGIELLQEANQDALLGINVGELLPLSPQVSAGWVLQHLGGDTDSAMPMTFRIGTAYHGDRLNAAMDLSYGLVDQFMIVGIGGELRVHPSVVLRLGYQWEGQDQGLAGFRGVSAGAGFKLGDFTLDYAYQPFGDLATSHRISVEYRRPRVAPAPASAAAAASGPKKKKGPAVKAMPAVPIDEDEAWSVAPEPKPRPKAAARAMVVAPAVPAPEDGPPPELPAVPPKPVGTAGSAASGTAAARARPQGPDRILPEEVPSSASPGDGSSLLPPPEELAPPPADEGGLMTPARKAGSPTTTPDSESTPSFGAPRRGGGR